MHNALSSPLQNLLHFGRKKWGKLKTSPWGKKSYDDREKCMKEKVDDFLDLLRMYLHTTKGGSVCYDAAFHPGLKPNSIKVLFKY